MPINQLHTFLRILNPSLIGSDSVSAGLTLIIYIVISGSFKYILLKTFVDKNATLDTATTMNKKETISTKL
jgi:hypothetical protein